MRDQFLQNLVKSFQKHSDGKQKERAKLESLLSMERDLGRQMHLGLQKAAEWENALGAMLGTWTGIRRASTRGEHKDMDSGSDEEGLGKCRKN